MLKSVAISMVVVCTMLLDRGVWADDHSAVDRTEVSDHVVESKVYFEFNSDVLSPAGRAKLDEVVNWVEGREAGLILIEGHADKVGSPEYNKGLAQRRAQATKEYLVKQGVVPKMIKILSYGEGLPAFDTEDESKANRRVVLFAVQKEPIIQVKTVTKVVERVVKVPVKEKVYVYQTAPVAEYKPLGVQFMFGGGLTNSLDRDTEDVVGLGGAWDARFAFFNRNLLGFELGYIGSAQEVFNDTTVLLGNGVEANLRLNLLPDAVGQPYAFAGVGWSYYKFARSAIEGNDSVVHVPAGLGLSLKLYRGLTLDVRGTVRAAFDDELFDGLNVGEDAGLEHWSATGLMGIEF